MAGFDTSSLSTFTEKSNEVLYNGILTGPNIDRYTVYQGINNSQFVNFVDVDAYEQSSDCSLSSSGGTGLNTKSLSVGDFTFQNEFCTRDLDTFPFPVVKGVVYDKIEDRLADKIISDLYQKVNRRIDKNMWIGTTAAGYLINGLVYQASACTTRTSLSTYDVNSFDYSAVTWTNIDNVIQEFLENIDQDMLDKGELVINMPFEYYNLYTIWRANNIAPQTMTGDGSVGKLEQWVVGYANQVKLRAIPGLAGTDYMIMTYDKNILVGTDVPSEITAMSNARFEYDNITRKLYHFVDLRLGVLFAHCDDIVANF